MNCFSLIHVKGIFGKGDLTICTADFIPYSSIKWNIFIELNIV